MQPEPAVKDLEVGSYHPLLKYDANRWSADDIRVGGPRLSRCNTGPHASPHWLIWYDLWLNSHCHVNTFPTSFQAVGR